MPATDPTPRSLPRDMHRLWLAVFSYQFGFGIYSAVFYNFATEVIKIQPQQLGVVEAVRETPGFLCILAAALTMRIAEPLLGSMTLFLMSVGMGAYAWVNGVHSLMIWSFVWSIGMHTWMHLQSSLVMDLAGDEAKGKWLGKTAGLGALGQALGMAAVMMVSYRLGYHTWFLLGSIFIAVGGLVMLTIRRNIGHAAKPRFLWKRKYRLYYGLTFLEGCRKQVFFTFAVYALTKVYCTPLGIVALLMLINNVVNFFGAPWVGRLIARRFAPKTGR